MNGVREAREGLNQSARTSGDSQSKRPSPPALAFGGKDVGEVLRAGRGLVRIGRDDIMYSGAGEDGGEEEEVKTVSYFYTLL